MNNESVKSTKLEIEIPLYHFATPDGMPIDPSEALDNLSSEYYGKLVENNWEVAIIEFTDENHEQHAASYLHALSCFRKKK